MLPHTWFLTLFCSRLGQCSLYKGGTSIEDELDRLKGEIMLQRAAGTNEVKDGFLRFWLGSPSVGKSLGAAGDHEFEPA
jgi:hypothetical protein